MVHPACRRDVIASLGVRAFPTFVFFIKKQKVSEFAGADEAKVGVVQLQVVLAAPRLLGNAPLPLRS